MPPTALHPNGSPTRVSVTGAVAEPMRPLTAGPMRPVRVISSGPFGCYLQLVDLPGGSGASSHNACPAGTSAALAHSGVIPLLSPRAVPLPTAVRVASDPPGTAWPGPGEPGSIGRHLIDLPGLRVRIGRTWRPARLPRAAAAPDPARWSDPVADASAAVSRSTAALLDLLDASQLTLSAKTSAALTDPTGALILRLIGAGPGTTPSGDDALAGALLFGHATGTHTGLAPAVRAGLDRTTAVSRALLEAAIEGYAVTSVAALVGAVVGGDQLAARRHGAEVARFGSSSGRDLIAGVVGAVRAATQISTDASHDSPNERDVA